MVALNITSFKNCKIVNYFDLLMMIFINSLIEINYFLLLILLKHLVIEAIIFILLIIFISTVDIYIFPSHLFQKSNFF
jgi:hypothetical protein